MLIKISADELMAIGRKWEVNILGGRTYESEANISLIQSNITVANGTFFFLGGGGGPLWGAGLSPELYKLMIFGKYSNVTFVHEDDKDHLLAGLWFKSVLYYYHYQDLGAVQFL